MKIVEQEAAACAENFVVPLAGVMFRCFTPAGYSFSDLCGCAIAGFL